MKPASGTGGRKDDLEQFEASYLAPTVCDHETRKKLSFCFINYNALKYLATHGTLDFYRLNLLIGSDIRK